MLTAVVSAAVTAAEEVANRRALSATCMAKHHAICVLLGGGDHWKGLPSLSHVELVVGYRSVVADGARKVSVGSVRKAVASRAMSAGKEGLMCMLMALGSSAWMGRTTRRYAAYHLYAYHL